MGTGGVPKVHADRAMLRLCTKRLLALA
eukprot:SAG25_NODE_12917_length_273_cov_1.494253_1_plen_27_part_01